MTRLRTNLLCLVFALIAGCGGRQTIPEVAVPKVVPDIHPNFGVDWPPRSLDQSDGDPLLRGELAVQSGEANPANEFRLQITLQRPSDNTSLRRWNKDLAFPEYAWMSKVRVWDAQQHWLWPNLPFLLRAHGQERVERYGGVDPVKHVDNDFAAVLMRPLLRTDGGKPMIDSSVQPMVSADWYPAGVEGATKESIVHIAKSDEFTVRLSSDDDLPAAGALAVWLIYADFLDAPAPRDWPEKSEFAGGILAYFQVDWQRHPNREWEFDIQNLVPPTDTGFDWESWSTGELRLEKKLDLVAR